MDNTSKEARATSQSPDSILDNFESYVKTPEESHGLAFEHAKEEIKEQVEHWRKESLKDEKDGSDTICYSRARLGIYTDLLAFLAEKY